MSSRPRIVSWTAVITVACLFLMAGLDYVTGQELVFSCAYLIPVSMAAWWFRRRWVVVMSSASGITAFIVDKLDGYEYSHAGITYWNAFTCFVISIFTGLVLSRLRQTLKEQQKTNQKLQTALDKLEASTQEIRKLQSGLQTVCAWTKRIKVGNQWMTPDEFLSKHLHISLTHGISPDAVRQMIEGLPNPSRSPNSAPQPVTA